MARFDYQRSVATADARLSSPKALEHLASVWNILGTKLSVLGMFFIVGILEEAR
jgi:hypothetical protein